MRRKKRKAMFLDSGSYDQPSGRRSLLFIIVASKSCLRGFGSLRKAPTRSKTSDNFCAKTKPTRLGLIYQTHRAQNTGEEDTKKAAIFKTRSLNPALLRMLAPLARKKPAHHGRRNRPHDSANSTSYTTTSKCPGDRPRSLTVFVLGSSPAQKQLARACGHSRMRRTTSTPIRQPCHTTRVRQQS